MADVLIGQGLSALPGTGQGQVFWGQVRRAQYTLRGFTASTTTPFSGNTPAGILVYDTALAYAGTSGNTPGAEFDMDHVDGLQLIVSNNGSGQTLSGITLTDWDTLPSGVAVPGQSYTTATNVATGVSVTLSALSLASGQAVRLWVPIVAGALRQWYANPTYAVAVTSGTGSLEVRTIPTYGSVRLTGSNALTATLQTVTTAGTAVQLPSIVCREVTLIALKGNTGSIYVGESNVSSSTYGAELDAKDSITLPVDNANLVWLNCSVSGEGVSYVAV